MRRSEPPDEEPGKGLWEIFEEEMNDSGELEIVEVSAEVQRLSPRRWKFVLFFDGAPAVTQSIPAGTAEEAEEQLARLFRVIRAIETEGS